MAEATFKKEWPRAVIMDLDGTLIDSAPDIALALNNALVDARIAPYALDEVRFMIGGGVPKLVERAFRGRGLPFAERGAGVIAGVLDYYTAAPAGNTTIYQGVEQVLLTLQAQGVKIGLCTNKPQVITEIVLDALQLTSFFGAIVGGTNDTPRKPDPMSLQMCSDQLGVAVDDCLLVGDSPADKGAADALGMAVFLVEYGYCKTPVAELDPDAVLKTMPELLQLLFPELETFDGGV